jgi:hypothetical protein
MGKALIWLGNKISEGWTSLICLWNSILIKLTVDVDKCPNKLCKCKEV